MTTSLSAAIPLTWLSGRHPPSHGDSLLQQLWRLLGDKGMRADIGTAAFEHRDLLEEGSTAISRYVYADPASQVLLFQDATTDGGILRELFCIPSYEDLIVGARLPSPHADQVTALLARLGSVQPVDSSAPWPEIRKLRTIVDDAAAEDALEGAPVARLVAERDYLVSQLADAQESLRQTRFAARTFREQLGAAASTLPVPDEQSGYPDSLAELGTWAEQYESRLIIAERAIRGGKKSLYQHPETVYRCLEHLATRYWEMKTGKVSVAAHDAALATMPGVSLRGSAGVSVAGEQGEAYFIAHRGRRIFLDLHLAKGGGMDQRYCMRIYFAWLSEEQRVLVGDLPAHLANSLS